MNKIEHKKAQYLAEETAEKGDQSLNGDFWLIQNKISSNIKTFVYGSEESISKSLGKVSNFEIRNGNSFHFQGEIFIPEVD